MAISIRILPCNRRRSVAQHVRPGHRHPGPLQRPDDRGELRAAALDEDHHVAGADRPPGAGQKAAGVEPATDLGRHGLGHRGHRIAGTAHPISDDIPALVRTLGVTSALMLSGDATFLGPDGDINRALRVLEAMWLNGLWGGSTN